MLRLRFATPPEWVRLVLADLNAFLQDHAANERKVSASAMQLAVQHPLRPDLVDALVQVAAEELDHFRRVYALLRQRGATLAWDAPDPYMSALRRGVRKPDVDGYLLDRLLLFAIIEARGHERFQMLAVALEPGDVKDFYTKLVQSEARHAALYLRLAGEHFPPERVDPRLEELLEREAEAMRSLPLRPALH